MEKEEKKPYSLSLKTNGYSFQKVEISQHYKEKAFWHYWWVNFGIIEVVRW